MRLPKISQLKDIIYKHKPMWLSLLVIFIGLLGIFATSIWSHSNQIKFSSVNVHTATKIDDCHKENKITYSCYKSELSQITEQSSPKAAFDLLKGQYNNVTYVKTQCHQLAHVVGREAYIKYSSLSETFSKGDNFCWSGYYHGAIEELTKTKGYNYILQNSNLVCKEIAQKQKYSFYHYNCVHGLGHGYMLVLNGNIFKSLNSCDSLIDNWERTSCYGGVFMQNIMNEQGPDAAAYSPEAYLRADEPMYPCTAVQDKYKEQCYLMQTSYVLQLVNYDFTQAFSLCSQIDQPYINICYASLGRDASGNNISDAKTTKEDCLKGYSEVAQMFCIEGAAKDFVSYFHNDIQAYSLCDTLDLYLKNDCRQTVKQYYSTF